MQFDAQLRIKNPLSDGFVSLGDFGGNEATSLHVMCGGASQMVYLSDDELQALVAAGQQRLAQLGRAQTITIETAALAAARMAGA